MITDFQFHPSSAGIDNVYMIDANITADNWQYPELIAEYEPNEEFIFPIGSPALSIKAIDRLLERIRQEYNIKNDKVTRWQGRHLTPTRNLDKINLRTPGQPARVYPVGSVEEMSDADHILTFAADISISVCALEAVSLFLKTPMNH